MDVKEGFLCPICMADLGDVIQLQVHFDEKHAKEDPALVRNLKEFFGKAKEKIKKGIDEQIQGSESASDLASLLNLSSSSPAAAGKKSSPAVADEKTVNVFGTEYESTFHPVSGINNVYLENSASENRLPSKTAFN